MDRNQFYFARLTLNGTFVIFLHFKLYLVHKALIFLLVKCLLIYIMFSPVITSVKPTLLNIIGEDCYKIIEDYKNGLERYEQNFTEIDECIKSKNHLKKYEMTIDLQEFRSYYIEKSYTHRIEFKIIIDSQIHRIKHTIENLVPTYLYLLKIQTMRFKETVYRETIIELMLMQ